MEEEASWEQFLHILLEENRLFEEAIQIGEEKTCILRLRDQEALEALTEREVPIASELQVWEGKRCAVLMFLVPDVQAEEVSIDILRARIPDFLMESFLDVREELRLRTRRFKEIHELNRQLLKQSMEVIRWTLELISKSGDSKTYQRDGAASRSGLGNPVFVTSA